MVGITRFEITDGHKGRGAARLEDAKHYWGIANDLYRTIFAESLHMPLIDGHETIKCTKEQFNSEYDSRLGIDVILRPRGLGECTLQEKFLTYDKYTLTIEHLQDWQTVERGDWFKLKAQYYFVGYDTFKRLRLDPWILVDWPKLQRETASSHIPWHMNCNNPIKVGAKASFLYVEFSDLPREVVVAASGTIHYG